MKEKSILLISFVFLLFFSSCSERLIGPWTIVKYETRSTDKEGAVLQNIGTITFNEDNTGQNILNYEVFGTAKKDTIYFDWTKTNTYVTIDSDDEEFGKTWLIISDKKKRQTWKTTSGSGNVQILELSRQDD